MNDFDAKLRESGQWPLQSETIDTIQVNLGRRCNQACRHCHLEAGPTRVESMTRREVGAVLDVLRRNPIGTLDMTGGAPELHPDFEYMVSEARATGCHVIDRCNLTVLLEPEKEHLIGFLGDHGVEIVASLPYFHGESVDRQRGPGVFARSLEALRLLNAAGYGVDGSGLVLSLVCNPVGAYLPGSQVALEAQFRNELWRRYGITFSRLFTMTNMPIGRFRDFLRRSDNEERYQQRMRSTFNPGTVPNLMCRRLVSVSWTGDIYDCDFNLTLGIPLKPDFPRQIEHFEYDILAVRAIATAGHCFGCTAGTGSSCGGTLA